MPAERLSMRKIREVLRLRCCGLRAGCRSASLHAACGRAKGRYAIISTAPAGLASLGRCPMRSTTSSSRRCSFRRHRGRRAISDQRPRPDWAAIHRELRRPNVTLALLWEEYRAGAPDGLEGM
jgi:hypothetical protein